MIYLKGCLANRNKRNSDHTAAETCPIARCIGMLTWITALTSRFRQSRDGAVAIRKTGTIAVTFDHRVIDGARASEFGLAVIQRLERA